MRSGRNRAGDLILTTQQLHLDPDDKTPLVSLILATNTSPSHITQLPLQLEKVGKEDRFRRRACTPAGRARTGKQGLGKS